MLALSIAQPRATLMSLLAPGLNPCGVALEAFAEGTWAREVPCGELLIHAARTAEDLGLCSEAPYGDLLTASGFTEPGALPRDMALAVVDVVAVWYRGVEDSLADSHTIRQARDAVLHDALQPPAMLRPLERARPGSWVIQCQNVRRFAEPLPISGRRDLFVLTPEQEQAVRAAMPADTRNPDVYLHRNRLRTAALSLLLEYHASDECTCDKTGECLCCVADTALEEIESYLRDVFPAANRLPVSAVRAYLDAWRASHRART